MSTEQPERKSSAEVFYGTAENNAVPQEEAALPSAAADSKGSSRDAQGEPGDHLSTGDLLFDGGTVPPSADGYESKISSTFDPMEYQARYDGRQEDVQALADGKQALMTTFHEFGVGDALAGELTTTVAEYGRAPLSDERLVEQTDSAMRELRREFGDDTDRMIDGARQVVQEAVRRMPWLLEWLEAGAGSDARVVSSFARIAKQRGMI